MAKRRANHEGSVRKRKDGRWEGRLRVGTDADGRTIRRSVFGRTQAEALAQLLELRQKLTLGVDLTSRANVSAYLDAWLDAKAGQVKERTLDLYRDWADRHVRPAIGRVELDKVTPLDIHRVMQAASTKSGVSTANKVRRMLFGAFRQAVRWQLTTRNPVDAVDALRETPKKPEVWSLGEASAFLDHAGAHRLHAAFYLLLVGGLRRGEILGLKWEDVKSDHLLIRRSLSFQAKRFMWSTPKTARGERIVALPEDAMAVLQAHKAAQEHEMVASHGAYVAQGLVFCSEIGEPMKPMQLQYAFKCVCKAAGVRQVRLHDLRHLHVSLLVKRGLDPRAIADRIGHADPAFTMRQYSHAFAEHRRSGAVNLRELLASERPVN